MCLLSSHHVPPAFSSVKAIRLLLWPAGWKQEAPFLLFHQSSHHPFPSGLNSLSPCCAPLLPLPPQGFLRPHYFRLDGLVGGSLSSSNSLLKMAGILFYKLKFLSDNIQTPQVGIRSLLQFYCWQPAVPILFCVHGTFQGPISPPSVHRSHHSPTCLHKLRLFSKFGTPVPLHDECLASFPFLFFFFHMFYFG